MTEDEGQKQVHSLSSEECSAIIEHMNQDHADALLLYAKVFGGLPHATAAVMTSIDAAGMELEATSDHETKRVRVAFDHMLRHPGDARRTLIEMVKAARGACDEA